MGRSVFKGKPKLLFKRSILLFKHLNSTHAREALDRGVIMVGTLLGYQNVEHYDGDILDREEGVRHDIDEVDHIMNPVDAPRHLEFGGGALRVTGRGASIQNGTVENRIVAEDCYIYSMSNTPDPEVGKEMSEDYDACLQIERPDVFCKKITRKLPGRAKFLGIFECVYRDREYIRRIGSLEDYDAPIQPRHHPAILKPKNFQYQQEYRGIWSTSGKNISELLIRNRKLCTHLSLSVFSDDLIY